MLDDQVLQGYADRDPGFPLSLNGDASVIAHPLFRREGRRGCVVVNGLPGPEFENVGHPAVSRDGRVVAYRVDLDDRSAIRIGDRQDPFYDFVTDPVLSADGAAVAYAVQDSSGDFVHAAGRKVPVERCPYRVFISDDGRQVGWILMERNSEDGSGMRVVANGKKGEAFGLVGKPVFSPVEPLVAYGAEEAGRKYVVLGDRKIETPDRVSDVSFSPDGRRVGYGARIGRELWWKVIEVR